MRIGYVRVSTIEQNEARQMELMSVNKAEKIFMDKASGKSVEGRQAFCEMMDFVRSGDTAITESICKQIGTLSPDGGKTFISASAGITVCSCIV